MKTDFLRVIILLGILSCIFACSDNGPARRRLSPAERTQQMNEVLNLTADQMKKIQQIYVEADERMARIREDSQESRVAMRDTMRAIRHETDELIEQVLNMDQIEKFEQYKQERRRNLRERFQSRDREQ
jgi:hypothetical protein